MASEIKWETVEPKEMGVYLVTLRSGKVAVVEFFHYTVAGVEFTDCVPYGISKVVACCKLSDIPKDMMLAWTLFPIPQELKYRPYMFF
jgi:hypothetical protein